MNSYQPITPPIIPPGTLELIQQPSLIIPPPPTPTVQVIDHMFAPTLPTTPEPTIVVPGVPTYTPETQYVYTPPAVQPTPIAQQMAIDPTLLLLGGVAVLALLIVALKK